MDVRIVALAKAINGKALAIARKGLSVGTHPVDFLIHITGSIKVGVDTATEVRGEAINYKRAFATVCSMLVEQCKLRKQPLAYDLLEILVDMAMRQNTVVIGDEILGLIESVERECTQVIGSKPKNGAVTTKLDYQFVPAVALAS